MQEVELLRKQLSSCRAAWKSCCESRSFLSEKLREAEGSVGTVDSEREANEILTNELDEMRTAYYWLSLDLDEAIVLLRECREHAPDDASVLIDSFLRKHTPTPSRDS